MVFFLTGCVLGAAVALCFAAPLLMPWPMRLRYLVNAQMIDPLLGLGAPPGLAVREMRLVEVDADRRHVEVVIEDSRAMGVLHRLVLAREGCPASVVARLDGWWALGIPLLVIDEGSRVHVCGPDGDLVGFRLVRERRAELRTDG